MNKLAWIGWLFVTGLSVYAIREWAMGERTQSEIDEAQARTDKRARKPEPKPYWLRRLEKKWLATGRLGEQKRNAA